MSNALERLRVAIARDEGMLLETRRAAGAVMQLLEAALEALEEAKQPHLVVEDCWYSCPKALDDRGRSQCCHDAISEGPCNCGADQHNAKIDAVLAQATNEAA